MEGLWSVSDILFHWAESVDHMDSPNRVLLESFCLGLLPSCAELSNPVAVLSSLIHVRRQPAPDREERTRTAGSKEHCAVRSLVPSASHTLTSPEPPSPTVRYS